MTYKVHSIHFH